MHKMDLDISKPVYIFIVDIFNEDTTSYKGGTPGDSISKCLHLEDKPDGKDNPAIALRGSSSHFGAWDVHGVDAIEISKGKYAVMVNDFIPKDAQYKWLNKNGITVKGDIDPATGFHYEPEPFIDRIVGDINVLPGEIAFICNAWGNYCRVVQQEKVEKWMPSKKEADVEAKEPNHGGSTLVSETTTEAEGGDSKTSASMQTAVEAANTTVEHFETVKTPIDDIEKDVISTEGDKTVAVSDETDTPSSESNKIPNAESVDVGGTDTSSTEANTTSDAVSVGFDGSSTSPTEANKVSDATSVGVEGTDTTSNKANKTSDTVSVGFNGTDTSSTKAKGEDQSNTSGNSESFLASEEIEMKVTTVSSVLSQATDNSSPVTNDDVDNNNTILPVTKVTAGKDEVFNSEKTIEKTETSVTESVDTEYIDNGVSEATFKRMSRISETETPEIDQVNEVIPGNDQVKITVKTTQRIPSSSSC